MVLGVPVFNHIRVSPVSGALAELKKICSCDLLSSNGCVLGGGGGLGGGEESEGDQLFRAWIASCCC